MIVKFLTGETSVKSSKSLFFEKLKKCKNSELKHLSNYY